MDGYSIRQLALPDLERYKSIRLEALRLEAGKFGNSYTTEAAYPETEWINRLTRADRACFGLFYKDELIGITAVLVNEADTTDGYMTQSYIREAHRGRKLSQLLYEARIRWGKEKGLKTLTISHRKDNMASRAAILRNGFVYTHSETRIWGDATEEENTFYKKEL